MPKNQNHRVSGCDTGLRFPTLIATLVTTWSSLPFQGCESKSQPWSQPVRNHHRSRGLGNCNRNPVRNPNRNHRKNPGLRIFKNSWTFRLRFRVVIRNPDLNLDRNSVCNPVCNPVRNPEAFCIGGFDQCCDQGCDQGCDFDSQPLKRSGTEVSTRVAIRDSNHARIANYKR